MYKATDLGTFFALGLNNKGQMVGVDNHRACIWSNGKRTYLPPAPGGDGAGSYLNDAGDVVGTAEVRYGTKSGPHHAILWHNGKTRILSKEAGVNWGLGTGLNNRGEAIGKAGNYNALLYSNGKVRVLPMPAEVIQCEANGINDRGEIIGNLSMGKEGGPYVWRQGHITLLQKVAQAQNVPVVPFISGAINNRGEIVGYGSKRETQDNHTPVAADSFLNDLHAYLYRDGVITDLSGFDGRLQTYSIYINDDGLIVGAMNGYSFVIYKGKRYDLAPLVQNLSDWQLIEVKALNTRGQILALGLNKHNNRMSRDFLLTPVESKP